MAVRTTGDPADDGSSDGHRPSDGHRSPDGVIASTVSPPRAGVPAQGHPRSPAHDDLTDAALVRLVGDADGAALETLHRRYGRPCAALARRVLGDPLLSQDVVQEVFLAVWRAPERFDAERGAFASWLLAMTHHKAVDAVRREENLRKRRTSSEALESTPAPGPSVDDAAWISVRRTSVRAALQDLPPVQREALALAYFGGYTQREIAGLTSTPLGTVKTRMLAGMRRLRTALDGVATAEPTMSSAPTTAGRPSSRGGAS